MIDQKQGQIVLVSSLDAKKGLPMDGPYTAAKFAITGFFEVLRQELKGKNIYVCNVFPARIDTPMIEHIKVPSISAKIPAEKVARAIVRGIKKHKVEVIVPGHLVFYSILNSISPRFMDWIVRIFHLEGWEE